MADASDTIYREIILEHYQHPKNRGTLEPTTIPMNVNPLCGDEIRIDVRVAEGRVSEIKFSGRGCAVSRFGFDSHGDGRRADAGGRQGDREGRTFRGDRDSESPGSSSSARCSDSRY